MQLLTATKILENEEELRILYSAGKASSSWCAQRTVYLLHQPN